MVQQGETFLPLIPPPREMTFGLPEDAFWIDSFTSITLGVRAGEETLFAARQLQRTLEEVTGLCLLIERGLMPLEGVHRIVLVRLDRDGAFPGADERLLGREGYLLSIQPERVVLAAPTETGLFYAVQTLRQLLRLCGRRLPSLTIRDWPVLSHRGVMLDVSRGKVPTRQTLLHLVEQLAAYKYNHFQLYIEHTFLFPSHPSIGAGADPLTADDMLALDAHCRAHHIELVPNFQSFGHQRRLLSLPQYAHLDEVGWRWSLTPAREETYQLLDQLYAEFLPNFTSTWFNVNCDETWDLGAGQSKALAEELGKGRLYLRHILRLRELAAKYGRRIMIWADILLHFPELVNELPEDVLLLDWHYEAQEQYPTIHTLTSLGRSAWVCPGTSSWNTLFPRVENALGNIRAFVREGLAAGASGMLLTDWGDFGHYQPLSLSWYPYLFGAAVAWSGPDLSLEHFDAGFAALFLGQSSTLASVNAIHRLGRAVTGPTLGLPNRSNSAYALFDEPLVGRLITAADRQALMELRAAALEALDQWTHLSDPQLRHDYTFIARLTAFAAEKVLLSQELHRLLQELGEPAGQVERDQGLQRLAQLQARLWEQRRRLRALAAEFETRWLAHARRSEMHQTLARFAALDERYQAALDWLALQHDRYAKGEPVDRERKTYTPGLYLPLWDEAFLNLQELVHLAGPESLPAEIRLYLEQEGLLGGVA